MNNSAAPIPKEGTACFTPTSLWATGNPIGRWGRIHRVYLETEHPGLYDRMILNGTLDRNLADAEERAQAMLEQLIRRMALQEGITENLKAADQMEWVRRMNSIRSRAEEIVHSV